MYSPEPHLALGTDAQRYEALFRISEALSACREFERLGSTQTRKVNVRLVAATNRDLEKMIAGREFRSDLYYRLNVFPIRIPPCASGRRKISLC